MLSGDSIVGESLLKASVALDENAAGDGGGDEDGEDDEILVAAKNILTNLRTGLQEAAQIDVEEDGGEAKAQAELERRRAALEGVMELRRSMAVAKHLAAKVSLSFIQNLAIGRIITKSNASVPLSTGTRHCKAFGRYVRRLHCRCRAGFI